MNQYGYLFLGLTAVVAALVMVVVYAVLRFSTAARQAGRDVAREGSETAFMAGALQEAMAKLRDQERAMKARAEASERLSSEIIASLTSGLLVTDRAGIVLTLNPAGRRLLGIGEEVASGALRDHLVPGDAPLVAVIEECLRSGEPIMRRTVTLPARAAGAAPTHLGVTVSPILDDERALQGAICLFTDLSAVMELEDQLRLKDSLARVGEMTAGIAHEFRNGLATIHGYSRLVDLDALPENFRAYVQGIRHETRALGEIVTNFLQFARPETLTPTPIDLRALVGRAADEIRGEVARQGGELEIAGEFPTVPGDEVLLRQAFSNLCRNALESCVAAHAVPRILIHGAVDAARRQAIVTVDDNGGGIDAAAGERIFRPFFTTKSSGTGLGLALVQKIIVTHNGRVTAFNRPEGGARFAITLPLPAA